MKWWIGVLIFLLLGGQSVWATEYFVATNGSDTNSGLITSPWKTIQKGVSVATAGDTIWVRGGVYPAVKITKSGSVGSRLTLAGYNSEWPVITGGEGITLLGASYVAVKGFDVYGNSHSWRGGITVEGGGNNIVQGNRAHNNTGSGTSGIRVWNSSFNKIIENDVYQNTFGGIDVTAEGGSATDNEIGFNKAHDHTLSGGDSDGMGGNANGGVNTRNNYHDNWVFNNSDDGIDTWNTSGNIVSKNISYGNGWNANHQVAGDGNGIKVGGATSGGNNMVTYNIAYGNRMDGFASNGNGNKFFNNTSYGNGGDGFNDGWRTSGSANMKSEFMNNIGMNNGRYNAYFSSDTATSSRNIWYSAGGIKVNAGSNYSTLASLYSATGLDNPNSSYSVDPNFIDPVSGNFGLSNNSIYCGIGAVACQTTGNIPGNFNGDSVVDMLDFVFWKIEYLAGRMTLVDFGVWKTSYLN
ncbi:right-handed parallel beta-helix repeat-containing protein [Candidatus Shapirobacteria bacterium]|nr:right-handed parallel beta-helix repeat-containing protein [Candidatus Shapirobacteria bacterium]